MASKLDEATRNDSKTRATLIFYEFHSGMPIFESYSSFCEKMGADFMEYQEFEFWFQRFSAGNFDLNYDRSKDRTITDMPVHIFQKICENLGDNYQNEYRFTLRHVCKSFRALVDSWIPNYKKILVTSASNGNIHLNFDNQTIEYEDKIVALDDLMSILIHPKLKLEEFEIWEDEQFAKKLALRLGSLKARIHIEHLNLNFNNWRMQKPILPFVQGETAEFDLSTDRILEFIEEISEINPENGISEIRFPRITIKDSVLYMKESTKFVKCFLKFPNLKWCHMEAELLTTLQLRKNIEKFGAKIRADRPDILHYSIPNSSDFFEIQFQKYGIRIERKSV
ncbi:hypothetical protein B9Z55_029150 [Caenorhabditis nigoni]|uniref:Uncharacterized protein n=1 Tax=Caenorhabditis nigoni TaxID=1611254 RepID=A0A2G5S8F2_9PELO|nr:hypothetical protein B9Z55_029150 [Caenorhabditis nigoni]